MKPIAFHPEARNELLEAANHYGELAVGLRTRFIDEIERATQFVHEHPEAGVTLDKPGKLRRWPLQRFPYYVIYRVESETLFILAIAHYRRRPGYWKERLA